MTGAPALEATLREIRRVVILALTGSTALVVLACSDGSGGSDAPADSLTQRQRDSVIGESGLPGARGIRGAQKASEAVDARADRLDSLGGR